MKVIGSAEVKIYPPSDELPHPFPSEKWWQESVVLLWFDLKQGIGGYQRIGHEPNLDGGTIVLWSTVWTPQALYRRVEEYPLGSQDRFPTGVRGGPTCRFEYDGRCHWTIDDPAEKVTAQLVVDDFHPAIGFLPKSSSNVVADFASNHSECNGRVTGELTVDGKHYKVDGLGIRDHSWGIRIWDRLRAHRWIAGVFDDKTGFCAMSWTGPDGKLARFGYLLRGEDFMFTRDVEIMTLVEVDGVTNRGGYFVFRFETGEVVRMDCEPLNLGVHCFHRGLSSVDRPCKVTWNGKVGFCDFETSHNAHGGTEIPAAVFGGIKTNGLHPI
jgi:hypothetical protein